MVFYFTCSDPRYTIYMGRDKHENEHLIAHGWPEDLWFHVDNHSSAHVYLRLPKGESIDDVPSDIVHECSQLTKANSIEGCKLSNVRIIYTMWSNLAKRAGMADGQVGYHNRRAVKYTVVEHRNNAIVNRLNKTKEEKHNNPRELAELRAERDAQETAEELAARRERYKQDKLDQEEARRQVSALSSAKNAASAAADELTEAMNKRFAQLGAARSVTVTTVDGDGTSGTSGSKAAAERELDVDLFGGGDAMLDVSDSSYRGKGKAGKAKASEAAARKTMSDATPVGRDDEEVVFDDGDDDWYVGGDPLEEALAAGGGSGNGGGGNRGAGAYTDKSLGAVGLEAAAVEAARKSEREMEKLAELAHQRKAAQAKAAATAAEAKAKAKAEELAASVAAAAVRTDALGDLRDKVESFAAAARASVDAARAGGGGLLEEIFEVNAAVQSEERMVLEAIFAEGFTLPERDEGDVAAAPEAAFRLLVASEADGADERPPIALHANCPPEYPSHLPPTIERLEGLASADEEEFVRLSLLNLFYERRGPLGEGGAGAEEGGELSAGVVHIWSEWLKDEWMGK